MEQPNLPENTPPAALPTSTLAILSLISGIVGLFFLPVIGGVAAIVTGNMARKETRSFPPTHAGDGMATAGMVMGWISILIWFILFCLAISVGVLVWFTQVSS